MTMTAVSVIVPTYNRSTVLPRAIESVIEQTYGNFELIIVDDGSTDETQDVVTSFDDERINYIRLSKNQGANTARNRGITQAEGEFISFLDSDDEYLPRRLEKTVNTLKKAPTSYGGVFHAYEYVDGGEIVNVSTAPDGCVQLDDLANKNVISGLSCTMFRAKVFDEISGFDESLPSSQDYDLYLRVLRAYDVIGISEVLSRYYIDEDGIRDNLEAVCEGQDRLAKKHKDILTNKRISRHHYSRAFYYAKRGQISTARKELRTAISIYPCDPLYYYHYLSSFGGSRLFEMSKNAKRRIKWFFHDVR